MWRFCSVVVLLSAGWLASCGCEEPDFSCGGESVRSSSCPSYIGASCNAAWYFCGLFLELPELAPGSYALEGTADGKSFSCNVEVAAASGSEPLVGCTDAGVVPGFSASPRILLESTPCRVTAELRRGDEVVAGGEFRPRYSWDEPWGANCDFCAEAVVDLGDATAPVTRD
jgi:hypothetical protein